MASVIEYSGEKEEGAVAPHLTVSDSETVDIAYHT